MGAINRAEIARRFIHYPPDEDRARLHIETREVLATAATVLSEILPESREKSLAFTHLEEAMFWANAAIARQDAG